MTLQTRDSNTKTVLSSIRSVGLRYIDVDVSRPNSFPTWEICTTFFVIVASRYGIATEQNKKALM